MQFLHRAKKFTNNIEDLKKIYMLQVRSKLDQSAVVWHSGLTVKNRKDLERVQKAALRVILGEKYINYENALNVMKIESLICDGGYVMFPASTALVLTCIRRHSK